jgi:glutathione synthetase
MEKVSDFLRAHGMMFRDNRHVPFTLKPCPFPEAEFKRAYELSSLFNELVDKISKDFEFLNSVYTNLHDDFHQKLFSIYKKVFKSKDSIKLGIFRSDYMVDISDGLKQIELNTISVSFAALSPLVSELHKYLNPSLNLPENKSFEGIVNGIGKAFDLYGVKDAVVVFIVQNKEMNIFDQRHVEYALFKKFNIRVIRKSLSDGSSFSLRERDSALLVDGIEVSVVYFRAGYGPSDYPSENEWDCRFLLEQSKAVKCPTVAMQLVGSKKVQQILSDICVLKRFLPSDKSSILQSCFANIYPLEDNSTVELALKCPENFVLKPQREGGGNNVFGMDIKTTLESLAVEDRNAYILMQRLNPFTFETELVGNLEITNATCSTELGIYSVWISNGDTVIVNETIGHNLRTKMTSVNEGGVCAGFAYLDSPTFKTS